MKRLFWPAVAAIVFHAAVLWLNPDIRKRSSAPAVRNELLHVSLVCSASQTNRPGTPAVHPQVHETSPSEFKKPVPKLIKSKAAVTPKKSSEVKRKTPSVPKQSEPITAFSQDAETTVVPEATQGEEGAASVPPTSPVREPSLQVDSGEADRLPPSFPLKEAVPIYKSNPPPEYPAVARRRGYEGTVILEVFVSPHGTVADLRLSQSSGYAVLDQAALASVKGWIFVPGRKGEDAVEMWVKVPICFRLRD